MQAQLDWCDKFLDLQKKLSKTSPVNSNIIKFSMLLKSVDEWNRQEVLSGLVTLTTLSVRRLRLRPFMNEQINQTWESLNQHVNTDFKLEYAKMIEQEVDETDKSFQFPETTFQAYLETLHDISDRGLVPYHGNSLRISKPVGTEGKSILISPKDPNNAMVHIYKDQTRLIFSEYDPAESAETYIREMYGSSGRYFSNYANFLDCRQKYPAQRHILLNLPS